MLHNPELRLKSGDRQDRGVNQRNARETDKGSQHGRIYSPNSHYNEMKCELTHLAKVQYVDLSANANIAFRGIMVNGAASTIKVFPDRYCQATTLYLLQMDTWCLESLGDAPQILRYGDGLEMLRVYNADAGEVRCGLTKSNAHNKSSLIDLEARRGDRAEGVSHGERLSEKTLCESQKQGCDSLTSANKMKAERKLRRGLSLVRGGKSNKIDYAQLRTNAPGWNANVALSA